MALHDPREVLDVAEDDRHALLVPVACVRARVCVWLFEEAAQPAYAIALTDATDEPSASWCTTCSGSMLLRITEPRSLRDSSSREARKSFRSASSFECAPNAEIACEAPAGCARRRVRSSACGRF